MLSSVSFHKFKFGVLGLALVFILGLRAFPGSSNGRPGTHPESTLKPLATPAAAPPPAPPVTQDSQLPNLFYGATPPTCIYGNSGVTTCPTPVLVFVHGLSGSYADWLESANCPPSPIPCGPKGPGVGTGNDMYDYAYAAGFRTAFMSLSANNTNNSASIQTNAAMLETIFPRILANFGVSKVYFICHSKGGLDLQAALATPQWLGIASAVLTFGTPNQGDALADWIFLTPNGQAAGSALGLLTPGVQSMETATVQQLRAQWDPIFENAQIPFYTVAGDVCTETTKTPPTSACKATATGTLLLSLTGGTSAPPNDELVTEPETLLPTSYAMELGVELEDHYQLRLGDYSFTMIYARVMGQESQQNGQPGLTRVATNGFGDQANTEAWSMAWFNGKLYVGTGREVNCVTWADAATGSQLPGLYPPPIGDCNPDYFLLPLQAEIWQYTPQTNTWLRVFQSPNSIPVTDLYTSKTVMTARDMGIRSLTVVNEPATASCPSPCVALYAGAVTSGAIFETGTANTPHAVGNWPYPPRILRSTDGVTWTPLPQDPGTFLGNLSTTSESDQTYQNFGIRSGGQLNGVLYLQVGDFAGVGRVIGSIPGTNPNGGDNNYQFVSPTAEIMPVWILQVFNGFMYAGTGDPYSAAGAPTEYGVWKTTGTGAAPYTWTPIINDNGAFAQSLISNYAMSFQIFSDPTGCPAASGTVSGGAGGCLYVGTDEPSEMVRIHPDTTGVVQVDAVDSWDLVIGNPRTIPPGNLGAGQLIAPIGGIGQYFDNAFTGHFWRMGVGGLGLYMSTYDAATESSYQNGFAANWSQEFGTDLYRTPDGIHWTAVSKIGLGDGWNTGGRTFQETPFGLYWGTSRPAVGGTQVFMIDNSVLDLNKDGVIDQRDVSLMMAKLNTKALTNDPMDLNQDGKITSADIQLLMTQCTYPRCAQPAVRPAASTLTPPVLHSAPGALGTTVSLDWPTVANAVDYLVYRIDMSPNDTTPPPGFGRMEEACGNPAVAVLSPCIVAAKVSPRATTTPYGYPGAPIFVTRVTGSGATATFSETPPSTLQLVYFVRAEDDNGNLSAPSNLVGGPSLATQ
jgi:hypothetical protein